MRGIRKSSSVLNDVRSGRTRDEKSNIPIRFLIGSFFFLLYFAYTPFCIFLLSIEPKNPYKIEMKNENNLSGH